MPSSSRPEDDRKPALVIVANEQTPYRLHFHRRLVAEISELQLWSVFTHELASSPWPYHDAHSTNPVLFGHGESSKNQSSLRSAAREWCKAGRIICWMEQRRVAAVVVGGYGDVGRLRIIQHCAKRRLPCLVFGDSNIACDSEGGLGSRIKAIMLPSILASCTGVLCCGSRGRAYFEKYGVPAERVFQVPYEPDYESIRSVPTCAIDQVRNRLGLPAHRRRILFCGRLERTKRVDLLLDAFRQIVSKRSNWDLVIAGDGSLGETLRRTVPGALRDRVIWTGFVSETEQLAALYASCDVLVLPSDYEPWGVVVTEAAAWNAIVASSVVGAAADVVWDGINGRVFSKGDLAALVQALADVTDPARIDSLKAAAPQILKEWRSRTDPVRGLRQALEFAGAL